LRQHEVELPPLDGGRHVAEPGLERHVIQSGIEGGDRQRARRDVGGGRTRATGSCGDGQRTGAASQVQHGLGGQFGKQPMEQQRRHARTHHRFGPAIERVGQEPLLLERHHHESRAEAVLGLADEHARIDQS
jgi:hypothetical protein